MTGQRADAARFVDLPKGRVCIREQGVEHGMPPVVLIHGLAGSGRTWDWIVDDLSRHRRTLRLDLPGHGESDEPALDYDVDAEAATVWSVLDRLGIAQVAIVAHSAGGDVAVAMIEQAPGRVQAVAFLSTAPELRFVRLALAARLLAVPVIGPLLWRASPEPMIRDGLAKAFAPGFASVPDVCVADLRRMTHRAHVRSRAAVERYKQRRGLPARLAGVRMPMLVVFGDQDQWVDPRAAEDWRTGTHARVEMLRGVGHMAMIEAPARTAELVLGFLRDAVDGEKRRGS